MCFSWKVSSWWRLRSPGGILLHLLVRRLASADDQAARPLLLGVHGLCHGRAALPPAERLALTADLKVARLPGPSKAATSSDKEAVEPLKRPRSDLTAAILEQLTTPLAAAPGGGDPSPVVVPPARSRRHVLTSSEKMWPP